MISVVISGKVGRQLPESRISSPLNPKMRAPRRAPRIPMFKHVLVMRIPMSDQEKCMPVLLLIVQSSVSEVIPLGQEQSDYKLNPHFGYNFNIAISGLITSDILVQCLH